MPRSPMSARTNRGVCTACIFRGACSDRRQHQYALSIFYRKLGMLETKFLGNSWRLFDLDEPDEVRVLQHIASQPCVAVFTDASPQ